MLLSPLWQAALGGTGTGTPAPSRTPVLLVGQFDPTVTLEGAYAGDVDLVATLDGVIHLDGDGDADA
jgi:hypothetical protein